MTAATSIATTMERKVSSRAPGGRTPARSDGDVDASCMGPRKARHAPRGRGRSMITTRSEGGPRLPGLSGAGASGRGAAPPVARAGFDRLPREEHARPASAVVAPARRRSPGGEGRSSAEGERVMAEFRSRAVRSLVELHEIELRSFLEAWRRFVASGRPMPEARGDAAYASPEQLVAHVQGAARGYLLWIGQALERPIEDLERTREPTVIVPRLDAFMEETLDGWRRHLAPIEDTQVWPTQYPTRSGEVLSVEQMLE